MKIIFLLLITLAVCFFISFEDAEEIRIRVISNSVSDDDIEYKNDVVLYLKNEILYDKELNDNYFKNNFKQIEIELNKIFEDIKVSYEYHTFNNKTYNGNAIKNASYKTLLIKIGYAEGNNWWGSIFEDSLQYESSQEVRYEWYFKKDELVNG